MTASPPTFASRPESALRRLLGLLPTGLALLAEGAWVAVVAALVQSAVGQPIILGPLPLAVATLAGLLVARGGTRRLGDRWPFAAVALVLLAGVAGWLSDAAVHAALVAGRDAPLAVHPGGWVAGLAFLRGMAHAERALPGEHDEPAGTLLAVGVVAIVVAFLLGGALAEPNRSAFVSVAVEDTIVFVAAGLVARSLARLAAVGGGFDWRRNPVWVGLLATLVGAILLVAVPGSFAVGPLVVLIVAALPVPLLVIGLLTGVDRRAVRFILGFSAVAAIVLLVIRAFGSSGGPLPPIAGPGVDPTMPPDQPWMTVAAWLVGLVVVALAVALLAALWMYQARSRADDDVDEDRAIDHGAEPPGGAGRRRWRRRPGGRAFGAPTDAVSAYRATIAELSRVEPFRRRDGETPAEHARRVRGAVAATAPAPAEGGFGAALDLLAADYELARFGGRSLTQAEDRRAIGRWRRVRAALRRRPGPGWRAATGNREGPS